MTIVNYDPGEIAYEAYRRASDGVSLISGAELPEWADVEPEIRQAWSAVEDGVITGLGAMRQELPLAEPGPAGPAKVIVVERDGHPDRRFAATGWEVLAAGQDAGDLVVAVEADEWVAQIGARNWDSVYVESAQMAGLAAAAAHTFTAACDGFHPAGQQCNLPAREADGCECGSPTCRRGPAPAADEDDPAERADVLRQRREMAREAGDDSPGSDQ